MGWEVLQRLKGELEKYAFSEIILFYLKKDNIFA
jgi:hypothetical protein